MACGPGEIAVIASSTSAGVLVITRTTGVPSGSHLAKNAIGRPAQSDTTSFPAGDAAGPSSAISVRRVLRLDRDREHVGLRRPRRRCRPSRMPYRSASSAARSARRSVASSRSAGQPERSSPDSSSLADLAGADHRDRVSHSTIPLAG